MFLLVAYDQIFAGHGASSKNARFIGFVAYLIFYFLYQKNDLLRIVVLTVKSLGGPKSCFSRYWQQILKIVYTLFSLQTG